MFHACNAAAMLFDWLRQLTACTCLHTLSHCLLHSCNVTSKLAGRRSHIDCVPTHCGPDTHASESWFPATAASSWHSLEQQLPLQEPEQRFVHETGNAHQHSRIPKERRKKRSISMYTVAQAMRQLVHSVVKMHRRHTRAMQHQCVHCQH